MPALLLAFLLAGCSGGGAPDDGGGDGQAAESTAEASGETTEVVAETVWPYQDREGEARVQVHALRVRGELAQLTLTVTAGRGGDGQGDNLYSLYGSVVTEPYLVDTANLTRYNVVRDSDGIAQAPDVVDTRLVFDQPVDLSYTFAAPPDDVTAMDLYVGAFPPVTDVPVVR
ncbi:hypothetical protein DEF23_13115 [Marinitenerispora sediminis]|uniref:DUF4352 domain-containing protein n=1 Tax=Marinitenerispora sediminis TaxID=1931232 RepID=A0A368TEY1_9ACTN|nr:hypothetical protein DEF23_13115 [Marinitenerispora sediminis]RCV57987.1 hypothetical protein DEF28_00815 [Marinitenerispora sediminis]RCV62587.1 hypothetical protein DEF24_00540 [Marinitenerispora sediminis]